MSRIIGYARVSTADQNPALQTEALTKAGAEEIFLDRASGSRADRDGLRQALDALKPGDTLAVWKLDRLGRSVRQLYDAMEAIRNKGCDFRSLTDSIDTSTANGRLLFGVLATISEFERDVIRERVTAGIVSSRRAGKAHGRPGKMSYEASKTARRMIDEGTSWNATARAFNIGKSTLHRALKRLNEED